MPLALRKQATVARADDKGEGSTAPCKPPQRVHDRVGRTGPHRASNRGKRLRKYPSFGVFRPDQSTADIGIQADGYSVWVTGNHVFCQLI